jgi:hypothetical protein
VYIRFTIALSISTSFLIAVILSSPLIHKNALYGCLSIEELHLQHWIYVVDVDTFFLSTNCKAPWRAPLSSGIFPVQKGWAFVF